MSEENKNNVWDNLSKEDLLKECQSLIVYAQKAKMCKEKLEEEIDELKKKIREDVGHEPREAILDRLSDEKLVLTTQLGSIELKNISLENKLKCYEQEIEGTREKLAISEAENLSFKTQLKRLADENEQPITNFSDLEGQIPKLKNVIKLQQEQLSQCEETKDSDNDLQNKEYECSKEVQKLDRCFQTIETGINNLTEDVRCVNMIPTVRGPDQNFDINVGEIDEIKKKNEYLSRELLCIQNINEKLKQKVQLYHSKLKMFAVTIKEVKKEKNQVLQLFKAYTEEIVDWKKQLISANEALLKLVTNIENEISSLKEDSKMALKFQKNFAIVEQAKSGNILKEDGNHLFHKITDKHDYTCSLKDKPQDLEVAGFYNEKVGVEGTDTLELTSRVDSKVDSVAVKQNYIEGNINSKNQFIANKDEDFMSKETALKQEIDSLRENNRKLLDDSYEMKHKLDLLNTKSSKNCFTQTDNCSTITKSYMNLKCENSDRPRDTSQMNEALKRNKETILKTDPNCDEPEKSLNLSETKTGNADVLTKKTDTKNILDKQGCTQKEQLSCSDSDIVSYSKSEADISKCEIKSMSTISKCDEVHKTKDIDGAWEERYGKLRTFAIKLKGKIREQDVNIRQLQREKEELQIKLSKSSKTVHSLQTQIDNLQDHLDKVSVENNLYLSKLNSVAESISKDKQSLAEHEDNSVELRKQIDILSREKHGIENWKKQLSGKVKILRKELESKNLLIKEYESKIFKLETDSRNKDEGIKKKSLEIEDYEESVEGLSKVIEIQNDVTQTQFGMEKCAIGEISEQNKLYEKTNQNLALVEFAALTKKYVDLEEILQQKDSKILDLSRQIETIKSQHAELSDELSRVISEHQKSINLIISERDQERNQILSVQHSLRHTKDALKLKDEELIMLKKEYETYRVRAQSVLEKKLGRDHGVEEKLLDELLTLKLRDSQLNNDINELRSKLNLSYRDTDIVRDEKNYYMEKCNGLKKENEELKNFNESLSLKYQEAINEHSRNITCLKVKCETLSQSFRRQLSEQELRHHKEMVELQTRFNECRSPIDTTHVYPNMLREEGEGSESTESNDQSSNIVPTPLEKLLDCEFDDEVIFLKKQLVEQESRIAHLTALLSDTEQDYAKHVQMNKLLKEEIRRQQRSTEREKQAENLEYLKNIILKFLTLKNSDERTSLVPVLNTILKLSPEETNDLILVAKGDLAGKGWNSYLKIWNSPK